MAFWKRPRKRIRQVETTGEVQPAKKAVKRSPPAPMEVKLLAMEALEADLSIQDVAELAGVTDTTISTWRRQYQQGGVSALCRLSLPSTRPSYPSCS